MFRSLACILIFLLMACSPNSAENGRDRDTLIRLSEADSRGLDPQIVSDLASTRIASDLFEGLTRFDANGMAEPGLADKWDISNDGRQWRFQLRSGLQFSDGHPVEASVFARAFARIKEIGRAHV